MYSSVLVPQFSDTDILKSSWARDDESGSQTQKSSSGQSIQPARPGPGGSKNVVWTQEGSEEYAGSELSVNGPSPRAPVMEAAMTRTRIWRLYVMAMIRRTTRIMGKCT